MEDIVRSVIDLESATRHLQGSVSMPYPHFELEIDERYKTMLYKAVDWFLWGFFMGMGWIVGNNVLNFVGQFLHR